MAVLNKIPVLTAGDYKNYNAYYDENPGNFTVQYLLNPKVIISDTEGVYRTVLGDLTQSQPYADYTSAYVKTFINLPFKKNPSYNSNKGKIDSKTGIVINETPSGNSNPTYRAQPTFLMACPGRDTLALDPTTKMLTNTRSVTQGGVTPRINNQTQTPTRQTTRTTSQRSSMGSGGGMGSSGGGY
tara:strand:- start:142 stop:696 length:555 start_codon:yes stop_codon:yes gene_type:complete